MDRPTETLPSLSYEGRAARITLRDPARRNALDAPALATLAKHVRAVRDGAVRDGAVGDEAVGDEATADVLVLGGEGPSFCAGFDLAACAADPRAVEALLEGLSACIGELRELDVPVIASVRGAALAGGCALLTACDFVVVARDAQLGYPVHRIGISPAVSAPSLFSRMGPATRALLMSNDLMDGEAAVALGLATHCVDDARLDAEVDALRERLLAKGPRALRETKRWIRTIEARMPGDLGRTPARDRAALERTRDASIDLASGTEFPDRLRSFWASRAARPAN